MTNVNDIYSRTDDGLDIICYYYPAARESAVNINKKFRMRTASEDPTPSASIKKIKGIWFITDFGQHDKALNPMDLVMEEERCDFATAVKIVVERHNIPTEDTKGLYEPKMSFRSASPEEKEGDIIIVESKRKVGEDILKLMGAFVELKHFEQLNWVLVDSISYVKNGKVTVKEPTLHYPILARRCYLGGIGENKNDFFYKIYEPRAKDPSWRFNYAPRGKKPARYVNGLFELKKEFEKYNEDGVRKHQASESTKSFIYTKFPEAIICSGERDAICAKSMGFYPLWFNSEVYDVSNVEMASITKMVDKVYNIPDLDATGVKRGNILANKFLQVHTVELPSWLKKMKDWRGKQKKDLRDWCETFAGQQKAGHMIKSFKELLTIALPAQFWEVYYTDKVEKKFSIDSVCLHRFLNLNGFFRLKDDLSEDTSTFIRIDNNQVRKITTNQIVDYLMETSIDRYFEKGLRNLMIDSTKVGAKNFDKLQPLELDFEKSTKKSQFFFFNNATWEVTKDGINKSNFDKYVWDDEVLRHDVEVLPAFFKINNENNNYTIDILQKDCCILNYLINTSRVYWREELEEGVGTLPFDKANKYIIDNKFNISGELLTEKQRQEQQQNLVSKIFTLGYMLHGYKSDSKAWAPFAMDSRIGKDGECNGRSGKSFFFKALGTFLKSSRLDGRMVKPGQSDFLFQNVDQFTEMIYIDDASATFPIKNFYSLITSDINVNKKGIAAFDIPFEKAPKIGFSTNYVPRDFDSSTVARLLFLVFSDYYHEATENNGYLESRSIRDDFGFDLLRDYTDDQWNLDFNFFAQCLAFYLEVTDKSSTKIQPPMKSIFDRKCKDEMGEVFENWATSYFSTDGGNLNRDIVIQHGFNSFLEYNVDTSKMGIKGFTKALRAFCKYYGHIYNPTDISNKDGRIQSFDSALGKTVSYFHIRTKEVQDTLDIQL